MTTKNKYLTITTDKDVIAFPHTVGNILIEDRKQLDLIDATSQNNELIFVILSKTTSSNKIIETNDLYNVGVLCKVLKRGIDYANPRIILEGIKKAKLISISNSNGILYSEIKEITEKKLTIKQKNELEKYRKIIISKLKEFLQAIDKYSEEIFFTLDFLKGIDEMIFYSSIFLSLDAQKKQELLESSNICIMAKKFIEFIDIELSLKKIDKKISSAVEKKFIKHQKKVYLNEKIKQIKKELGDDFEDKDESGDIGILKKRIKKTKLSNEAKKKCLEEVKKMESMLSYSSEYHVIKNYIEFVLSLPWGKYSKLDNNIQTAENILNRDHYGLEKVKERILEFLAVYQRKKKLTGQIICFVGAPGVGKTSLAKSIAEALNRKYVKISLGGVRDEAEIRGHRKTYVGAMQGKIINAIKKAETSNPLILLDEIDKMGMDYHGDPASALLEVLDPEQNKKFEDHYLETEYDLSDVMFITTANNIANIPIPLRDRMEIIKLSGYTEDEKLNIAIKYLIPKQLEENGLKKEEFSIDKDAIIYLIRRYTFEAGVRNLEREIAKLIRKSLKEIIINKKIKKISITTKNIKKYLGVEKFNYNTMSKHDKVGVAVGLAYTDFGGDLLNIESLKFSGSGKLITTGKLGDVMKESAQAAFSYVRSIANKFNINAKEFNKYDFHLHVPEGATPKDGPSAGVAITASLLSAMTGKKINKDVAMTGEISLTGQVMPIGGLKEKLLAALRGNIKTVIIPKDNEKNLEDVPENVKKLLKIIPVDNLNDALKIIVKNYNAN